MTVKEYLNQAYRLDQRIDAKIAQISSLNDLATKCTATLSDMPRNPNRGSTTMADAVDKIVDLQREINRDIDRLVDLDNPEYQTILEKRYLCFMAWEQIAVDLGYDLRYLHKLHHRALDCCVIPEETGH